ncbi:MAG: hypothetical protein O2794_00775 [bacterium]|nr:hypothetical protein [bacterium]
MISKDNIMKVVTAGGLVVLFLFFFFQYLKPRPVVYQAVKEEKVSVVEAVPDHIETPNSVRAVYMTSWVAGSRYREPVLEFIKDSSVNAVVIDIKDDTGRVSFITEDEVIKTLGSEEERISDIEELIDEFHRQGVYVIGRISVFQDPYAARRMPESAVMDIDGGVWRDRKGLSFIDPGAKDFWDYIVRIGHESVKVGFDELNFDYVRFPSDGAVSRTVYRHLGDLSKEDALENFFKYLGEQDFGVPTSADLFGLTTWSHDGLGIGQVLEKAAPYFDYIAPMVYPSHYADGFQGYDKPGKYPYEIIHTAMLYSMFRLEQMGEDPKKLRPWIQDFEIHGIPYGQKEVEAQMKATYDAGLTSWMSWDASNKYTQEAYR